MSLVKTNNQYYHEIANALRIGEQLNRTYQPKDMVEAIFRINETEYTPQDAASMYVETPIEEPYQWVCSDDIHYKGIANALRKFYDSERRYYPKDMAMAIIEMILKNRRKSVQILSAELYIPEENSNLTIMADVNPLGLVEILWGDGERNLATKGRVTVKHSYSKPGWYTVRFKGIATSIDYSPVIQSNYIRNITFDSIGIIGEGAYAYSEKLEKAYFGNRIATILPSAFANCLSLKEIDSISGLQEIGAGAFQNCTGLVDITLPESLLGIGKNAFQGCDGIVELRIPNSVQTILDFAIQGKSLEKVYIGTGIQSLGDYCVTSEKYGLEITVYAEEPPIFLNQYPFGEKGRQLFYINKKSYTKYIENEQWKYYLDQLHGEPLAKEYITYEHNYNARFVAHTLNKEKYLIEEKPIIKYAHDYGATLVAHTLNKEKYAIKEEPIIEYAHDYQATFVAHTLNKEKYVIKEEPIIKYEHDYKATFTVYKAEDI